MKPNWIHILFALILGMMLPSLVFRLGALWDKPSLEQPTEPTQITQPTQSTEPPPTEAVPTQVQIPVLSPEGYTELMDIEDYILGVVLAEMPATFEEEALKAQAVVACTYAWKRCEDGDHHSQGAVCTDPNCCQAYITTADYLETMGTQADVDKIAKAVLETSGQVLTYEGELAEATYFSCSGGRTEDAAAVWGTSIPYLQSVDSPGEEGASVFIGTATFTPEQFSAALGRTLSGDPKSWLGPVTWSEGGGVASMILGGQRYTGVELRRLLDLNSTAFTIVVKNGNFVITTKGKGHRVGMSQYGADAMAVLGSTCQQILSHYYPGTVIDKLEALQ